MALVVIPGPLNVQDGERINVETDLAAFVSGTNVENIGRAEAAVGESLDFVTATSEPPASALRNRSTLWFKRGEGRLYKWELNATGATGGRWLAISERKESLIHLAGTASADQYSLVWLPSPEDPSEAPVQAHRFGRRLLSLAAHDEGSASSRALLIGPFRVLADSADPEDYVIGVELGFTQLKVDSTSSPLTMVGKTSADYADNQAEHFNNIYDRLSADNLYVGLGYVTQSGAKTDGQTVNVFFFGEPTHLVG